MIIGLVGYINSGKDTVGDYLVSHYNFKKLSFASSLKDAVSSIFSWDRNLLEGTSNKSRIWREQVDPWWSKNLGKINKQEITPRLILQYIGTEVFRENFNENIWVLSLIKRMLDSPFNYVVSDVRFENEIKAIASIGKVFRVRRNIEEPVWYNVAKTNGDMKSLYPQIHKSEYDWIRCGPFSEISNLGTLEDLYKTIDLLGEVNESKTSK